MKIILVVHLFNILLFAQKGFISGLVLDTNAEPMPGANISFKNRSIGTISDGQGKFIMDNLSPGSYELIISYIGYKPLTKSYVITAAEDESSQNILGKMGMDENFEDADVLYGQYHRDQIFNIEPDAVALRQVDVTAHQLQKKISDVMKQTIFGPSKIRESFLTVGASVDAVSIKDIKMSPALNFYEGLDDLKEIETKSQSTIYTTLNVRGIGTTTSRSYSQLVDGMQAFRINYGNTYGNIVGVSEIDVANVELVHGAASVMYGPYSTDGLILMSTKTPWFYQGASYQLKTGYHYKPNMQMTPFVHSAFRFAKAYDKLAFKLVFSDKRANEWADPEDDSTFIQLAINGDPSSFDMLYRHGDDTPVNEIQPGVYSDELGPITRTGYWEKDILPTEVYNTKVNSSLRYKLTDEIEMSYDMKGGWGSFTFLDINKNHMTDMGGINHGISVSGNNWSLKGYTYQGSRNPFVNIKKDWLLIPRDVALNLQNYAKPDSIWYKDYIAAFSGEISGVTSNDHSLAREFADSENSISDGEYHARLVPGTSEFKTQFNLYTEQINNSPSSVSDNNFKNFEFIYDLTDYVKFGGLQVGGNFRSYRIGFYEGNMSNTDEINEEYGELKPWEYALFIQSTKWFFDEKFKIQGALRYDNSDSYGQNISPSFSTVLKTLTNQYLRFSYQKASLNPSIVWAYLHVPQPNSMAIGGAKENKKRLGVEYLTHLVSVDFATNDTTHRFVPEPSPEKLDAYEIGYKALLNEDIYMDVNYFYNHRSNMRNDSFFGFDPSGTSWNEATESWNLGTPYYIYTHTEDMESKLHGISFALAYNLDNGMILSGNYNFINDTQTISRETRETNGEIGTSRPQNRYKFSLNHPRAFNNNLGYSLTGRYSDKYWFDSFLWYGVAEVGGNFNIDAQVSYIFTKQNILLKGGINNLIGKPYRVTTNSPKIGSTFYLALEYDGLIR